MPRASTTTSSQHAAITRRGVLWLAVLFGCHGRPGRLADPGGPLPPCPSTPNCVSTEATDPRHRMEPIPFTGDPAAAQEAARRALLAEPRLRIVMDVPGYLRAEATSLLLRFVDDVEIVIDGSQRLIRFRSASRVGRSDLGVNRKRMERVASRLK